MKTLSRILVIAGGLALLPTLASADHRPNNWWQWRDGHQQQRIENGYRNGSLTPHEAWRLQRHNDELDRQLRRALRDGYLSKKEVRRLNKAFEQQDRVIYWEKRDDNRHDHHR